MVEDLFRFANLLALAGWASLLAGPLIGKWADVVSGRIAPLLLSVGYAGLVLAFWSGGEGGFGTLADVMLLFTRPEIALAGWVHYLAFDLFVGAWIAKTAREETIPFLLVIPCLVLTFLFGPAGFLAFAALRVARIAKLPQTA